MSEAQVAVALSPLEAINAKIAAAEERLADLQAAKERLSYVSALVKGVQVEFAPRQAKDGEAVVLTGRILAVIEQEGRGTWYKVRANEDTENEEVLSIRLVQIKGLVKPAELSGATDFVTGEAL